MPYKLLPTNAIQPITVLVYDKTADTFAANADLVANASNSFAYSNDGGVNWTTFAGSVTPGAAGYTAASAEDGSGAMLLYMPAAASSAVQDSQLFKAVFNDTDLQLFSPIEYGTVSRVVASDTSRRVDVGSISGDSTAADNLEAACDGTGYNLGNGSIVAASVTDKTGYSISGTITTLDALDTAQDAQHASTQSDIAALNDLSAAQVNAEVDTALADYDSPTNTEMVAAFAEIKGVAWSSSTDTLEAIRDRGDTAWTTATGFSTLDQAGVRAAVGLADANLDTQISTIDTVVDGIKIKTDQLIFTGGDLICTLNGETVAIRPEDKTWVVVGNSYTYTNDASTEAENVTITD